MAYVPAAVIAGAGATAAVAPFGVVFAAKPGPPPPDPEDCDLNKPLLRAKDLPIYGPLKAKEEPKDKTSRDKASKDKAAKDKAAKDKEPEQQQEGCKMPEPDPDDRLMDIVKATRKGLWNANEQLKELQTQAYTFFSTGAAHLNTSLEQLRVPENENMRYGVIAGGGALGLIFALRGGLFKKLVYTSTGALTAAAVCYPEEAEVYSKEAIEYGSIILHFFNAAMKDLTGAELKVPEFNKLVPIDRISAWIGSAGSSEVSKTSPTSASLLPPAAETPSHVISLPAVPAVQSQQSGRVPMPPLDRPTSMSQSVKGIPLRDQSNPNDKDMYSLRG